MLHSLTLNDQQYEDLLAEAMARIPLYTKEWTNFNPSDPGITMLQNLSAFSLLQQSLIDEVTDTMRLKLLKLLGFTPQPLCEATLLVAPERAEAMTLPAHEKLMLGSLSFETTDVTAVRPWSIRGAYAEFDGKLRDVTYPLRDAKRVSTPIFGPHPQVGDTLFFVLEGVIAPRMTLHFHSEVDAKNHRNPFDDSEDENHTLLFAQIQWQYYTVNGWEDVPCVDETRNFLISGGIHITLGEALPVLYTELPQDGFALRATLVYADYDIAPRLLSFTGGLFELHQRSTKAASFLRPGGDSVSIQSAMLRNENLFVFCRETPDGPYFAYTAYTGSDYLPVGDNGQPIYTGRFFERNDLPEDVLEIRFDRSRFGFAPIDEPDAVCVVCYDVETLHQRWIGTAYGYENQTLDIPGISNVLPTEFSLLAELPQPDGQLGYYRILPGDTRENRLHYEIRTAEGELQIIHNGMGGATRLLLCSCAVTAGEAGNVRSGARLSTAPSIDFPHELREPYYFAPGKGRGGHSAETVEQMRQRFIRTLQSRSSAVSVRDYEEVVRTTPGLCIHKVRAVADEQNNLVKVTVKCYTEQEKQKLPRCYITQIKRRLNAYRMIATQIELQQPQYVPIHVAAVIHVRNYYQNAQAEIEQLLQKELDYITTDHGFGETIHFTELYQKLEQLECVDRIYSLTLHPAAGFDTTIQGADIVLGESCLCCLGKLTLELNTSLIH